MNRKIILNQIKEEQLLFYSKIFKKKLEEYKKALELRDSQLAEAKNVFKGVFKSSYD